MISIVNAPEESAAENVEIESAKEDEVVLVLIDVTVKTSVIFFKTLTIAFRLDCKTSILYIKYSIDPTSNPPEMSTAVATSISPDDDMTSTPRDAAVTSVLENAESFWLKIVICVINVCLNVIKDCLMNINMFNSPGVGCEVKDPHNLVMLAAVA